MTGQVIFLCTDLMFGLRPIKIFATECSPNRVVEKNRVFLQVSFCGHQFGLPKNSLGLNDVISMFIHVLSFECCAIMQTFECRGSLSWTVADEMFSLKFEVSANGM